MRMSSRLSQFELEERNSQEKTRSELTAPRNRALALICR